MNERMSAINLDDRENERKVVKRIIPESGI